MAKKFALEVKFSAGDTGADLMINIQRVLCPVDFSDGSRRALGHAIAMARWYGATVTALHVYVAGVPPAAIAPGAPLIFEPMVLTTAERERLTAQLATFVDAQRAEGVAIEPRLAEASTAWREIIEQATITKADLLVLGTHGRSGFERLILGSVTEKVLRKSACPVLTVPPADLAVPATPALFKRILCAIDFSPPSLHALTWALSLAEEADAELALVHVLDLSGFPAQADVTAQLDAYRLSAEQSAMRRLADAVPPSAREYCRVEEIVSVGRPHSEILRLAAERRCDLIVMGVAGHGPVERAFFGSTAQHVVRGAACPVLTIRE